MATFRLREASSLLGVSTDTLRRWAEGGRIETITDASRRLAVDGVALARLAQWPSRPITQRTRRWSPTLRATGSGAAVLPQPRMERQFGVLIANGELTEADGPRGRPSTARSLTDSWHACPGALGSDGLGPGYPAPAGLRFPPAQAVRCRGGLSLSQLEKDAAAGS